jgi:hypothetical protein
MIVPVKGGGAVVIVNASSADREASGSLLESDKTTDAVI